MSGGELFTHLSSRGKFSEAEVRIYAAEILLAIQHLHDVCLNFAIFISKYFIKCC